jgi:hypothetical protein
MAEEAISIASVRNVFKRMCPEQDESVIVPANPVSTQTLVQIVPDLRQQFFSSNKRVMKRESKVLGAIDMITSRQALNQIVKKEFHDSESSDSEAYLSE